MNNIPEVDVVEITEEPKDILFLRILAVELAKN